MVNPTYVCIYQCRKCKLFQTLPRYHDMDMIRVCCGRYPKFMGIDFSPSNENSTAEDVRRRSEGVVLTKERPDEDNERQERPDA